MRPENARLPFAEAIEYAKKRKVVLPDTYYGRLQGAARSKAFSIAGISSAQQLREVLKSLNAAMQTGQTFDEWREEVRAGRAALDLPRHRLDTIFRTNLQTSYNRGRIEQQRRVAQARPFWMYDAINDSRVRPNHLALDGFIAQADDPFWKTHYPPLGYNCRCTVISLTEREARRRGYGTRGEPEEQADPGWDYDKGDDLGAIAKVARKKAADLPPAIGREVEKIQAAAEGIAQIRTPEDARRIGAPILREIERDGALKLKTGPGYRWDRGTAIGDALRLRLERERGAGSVALTAVQGSGRGADKVREAAKAIPASWVRRLNDYGTISARFSARGRGWCRASEAPGGHSEMSVPSYSVALHELMHVMQRADRDLDAILAAEHSARTAGEALLPLRKIYPGHNYAGWEVARRDKYITAYYGKEYGGTSGLPHGSGEPREVLPMAVQQSIGWVGSEVGQLYEEDRAMLETIIGLLFGWDPR